MQIHQAWRDMGQRRSLFSPLLFPESSRDAARSGIFDGDVAPAVNLVLGSMT
jgi:hypothetical protein